KTNKKSKTHTLKYKSMEIIAIEKPIINNGFVEGTFLIFQKLDSYKEFIRQFDDEMEAAFLLKTIMETTNDAIVYVNKEGYIEMISKPYADFLQVKREEVIGKHVRDV